MVLPPNTRGRDYLLGDLHGCVDALEEAMKLVSFDPEVDRIIAVGDLIDRGPRSLDALKLARQPWFFSTLGNHEIMMLEADDQRTRLMWQQNGGEWFYELTPHSQEVSLAIVETLPHAITLEQEDGTCIGICHAEWPADNWRDIEEILEVPWMRQQMLWGRTVLTQHEVRVDPGAALTVHGHTPLKTPTRLGSALFIDTGCVHGGKLTLIAVNDALTYPELGRKRVPLY